VSSYGGARPFDPTYGWVDFFRFVGGGRNFGSDLTGLADLGGGTFFLIVDDQGSTARLPVTNESSLSINL
jgi:hypothetical protein